jgi:molecular chaperone GrpE
MDKDEAEKELDDKVKGVDFSDDDDVKNFVDDAFAKGADDLEKILDNKKALDEAKKNADDYYDQLLRLKAEFENYRRRADKEKREFLAWGKEEILIKQIAIEDVLEQALKSAKANAKIEDIIVGLEMVIGEFSKMLGNEGVEEIKLEKFDPNVCEALDYVESDDKEEGEILEVYQKGYRMNGKLIRTAKVKVAKHASKEIAGQARNDGGEASQEIAEQARNDEGLCSDDKKKTDCGSSPQ